MNNGTKHQKQPQKPTDNSALLKPIKASVHEGHRHNPQIGNRVHDTAVNRQFAI